MRYLGREYKASLPSTYYVSSGAFKVVGGLFLASICSILVLTSLYSAPGQFWRELICDQYEVSLAIATFAALVTSFCVRKVPDRVVATLIEHGVIAVNDSLLSDHHEKTRAKSILWLGSLLVVFWTLGLIALYAGNLRPKDFDRYGTLDVLCGRFVWVSIFAWLFWASIAGMRNFNQLLKGCTLTPLLWAEDGEGELPKLGTAILTLATPALVGTALGLVWLSPTFTGANGYEGAEAVAAILAVAIGVIVLFVFVPCIFLLHRKIDEFRTATLKKAGRELRDLYARAQTDIGGAHSALAFNTVLCSSVRGEVEQLPSWPFSPKAGLLFFAGQVVAVITAAIKARDIILKIHSM